MSLYGPKRHLDRFIRFSTAADARNQQTHTQTDHATTVTVGRVLCYTIQCSKSIYNARMVSLGPNLRRAQSLGGERWRGTGLREGTGKIMCLTIPLKRSKRRAIANFAREFIPQ